MPLLNHLRLESWCAQPKRVLQHLAGLVAVLWRSLQHWACRRFDAYSAVLENASCDPLTSRLQQSLCQLQLQEPHDCSVATPMVGDNTTEIMRYTACTESETLQMHALMRRQPGCNLMQAEASEHQHFAIHNNLTRLL